MLKRTPEAPKRPVRRGTRGSFKPRFRTISPKTPDRRNAKSAENFFSSLKTTFNEIKIRTKGITFGPIADSEKTFVINDKGRIIITKIKRPIKHPIDARCTACKPKPFFNISCPGRTESSVPS